MTDPGRDALADLDFTPEVPCEQHWHDAFGTGLASRVIGFKCPGCGHEDQVCMCEGCWVAFMRTVATLRCGREGCGHLAHVREYFTSLTDIDGKDLT